MNTIQPSRVSSSVSTLGSTPGESQNVNHDLARRPGAEAADITGQLLHRASTTELIFALEVFGREQNKTQNETAILAKKDQMTRALRDEREAIEKRQSEEADKAKWGGIKDKLSAIATGATVVASIATTVASAGVSAPLAVALVGMAISMAAKPVGDACGSKKLEMGMMIGGSVLSLAGGVAGAIGAGTTASSASAGVSGGVASSAGSATASSSATASAASAATEATGTAARAASSLSRAANMVSGAATTALGYATYQTGHHDALADRAQADAIEAGAIKRRQAREMDALIDLLKEAEASFSKAKTSLRSASESYAASNLSLATMGVRA